ncbi:hypothetical protein E2C01_087458 [Portunus trituberculatus]|uniref:Uncharacterized protein n=1 Tax=Portunus trituberculatus TaxID=210409 RepID=A0A5B7J852_PORTR|nr:hypothetical protein [Portunus trituberculatus]
MRKKRKHTTAYHETVTLFKRASAEGEKANRNPRWDYVETGPDQCHEAGGRKGQAGVKEMWKETSKNRRGTVEPCLLWGLKGLQALGFESCPRSECRLGFLTRGNGFLAGGF